MRIATLVLVVIGLLVVLAVWSARRPSRDRSEEQPKPVDAERSVAPPRPQEDPGPATPAGDPAPGSREDRARHGKP